LQGNRKSTKKRRKGGVTGSRPRPANQEPKTHQSKKIENPKKIGNPPKKRGHWKSTKTGESRTENAPIKKNRKPKEENRKSTTNTKKDMKKEGPPPRSHPTP
jgi:hypothetical protein